MRTFSRGAHPRGNRLAGPALDFAELPDARMHWSPLPRRGTTGIEAWQPQWMCMRCHNELQLEHICVPDPTPACPLCLTLMLWEVDLARRQERWVCSRCPYARSARPLALGAAPPCDLPDLPSPAPHRRLHRPNTQPSGLHPCPCVTGPTLPCTFPCCSMPQACLQPRRNATGDRALPSMNGGLPLSMRCGHALLSPCKSFPQLWSMSPWLSRPRFCTHPRFYGFGPGPRNGPDTAQLPWHPKATISQHRYRRRCLLFWSVPQPSPPLHVS